MCSSTSFGAQPGSGKVTLKNASLARFSNGPGMSIEANVSARMNGGVSSTTGGTGDGMVTMRRPAMNPRRSPKVLRNACSSSAAAGGRRRGPGGPAPASGPGRASWPRAGTRAGCGAGRPCRSPAAGRAEIDRLFPEQLLAVRLRPDAVVAAGPGQQISLEELLVGAQRGDDPPVPLGELAQGGLVLRVPEGGGDVLLEEGQDPGQLLEGDLGVPPRRGLEILPGDLEHRGHLLLARDHGAEPLVGRREIAAHDDESDGGDAAGVEVRILLPSPDGRQLQQVGADVFSSTDAVVHVPGLGHLGLLFSPTAFRAVAERLAT